MPATARRKERDELRGVRVEAGHDLGLGGTPSELDEHVAAAGRMWGGADYERIAQRFGGIHDELVASLEPATGVRWLDLATGTGGVAIRAAAAGASVTGADISEDLLGQAAEKAKLAGVAVEWIVADAQSLPFADAGFDVVSSCFGVIFGPDPQAVAVELARLCRPGGRLGLTCWRPEQGPHAIYEQFAPGGPAAADEWGKEARVESLLGAAFELSFSEEVWHLTGESPEAVWELMTEGAPPVKALLRTLEPGRRDDFRVAMLDYWAGFSTDKGVAEPRRFLSVRGLRR